MTENEKNFVRAFIDFDSNLMNAQAYIKENFGVSSTFNDADNSIKLFCEDNFDAFKLVAAKDFLNENFDESMLTVIF
jgi:hypothetical protein